MGFESPESLAAELELFVDNDADLYRQQTVPIFKNLITKMARGIYDHHRAVDLFMHLAESGAKKYSLAEGKASKWHDYFPAPVRKIAAESWARGFETEAALGNYDHLLPKKYQETKSAKSNKPRPHSSPRVGGDSSSDGAELAQRVASNLNEHEIEKIVLLGRDPPGRKRGPVFKKDYLNRMMSILNAMRGS